MQSGGDEPAALMMADEQLQEGSHLGQQAAVEVGHHLSHACTRRLRRQLDNRPGGDKHQAEAVHHVEQPRHPNVGVLQQIPA